MQTPIMANADYRLQSANEPAAEPALKACRGMPRCTHVKAQAKVPDNAAHMLDNLEYGPSASNLRYTYCTLLPLFLLTPAIGHHVRPQPAKDNIRATCTCCRCLTKNHIALTGTQTLFPTRPFTRHWASRAHFGEVSIRGARVSMQSVNERFTI